MRPPRRRAVTWLLAVPFLGIAWPPLYNREHPQILGIPFFYAYQLLVIAVAAACMVIVLRAGRGRP